MSTDDRLAPLAAADADLSAREFVAGLDLRGADASAPRVAAAMIASIDGRATIAGRATGLGNPADRALLRELRAAADAVLVGSTTLIAENYTTLLDSGQRDHRVAGGRPPQPIVSTVTRRPQLLAGVPLFANAEVPVVVYCPQPPDAPLRGADAVVLDPLTLPGAIADLHGRLGAGLIVCEGGPRLLRGLVGDGALDDLVLTVAPLLVSGDAPAILTGDGLDPPLGLRLAHAARAGDHLMLHYRR